jgi:zinc transport system permease protein
VCLLAPLLGGLSHLVVARRLAFFSAALGQAALTGLTIGIVLGEPLNAAYGGIFGFCFLSAARRWSTCAATRRCRRTR